MNNHSLLMNMIPTNTRRIVLYLLKNPEQVNINQIARILKISVGSAFKILKELESNNILLTKELGNAKYYQINIKNKEAKKLCELLLLIEKRELKGYAKIYSEEIEQFKDSNLIILFGSVLRTKQFNDVDVLFVTNKPKAVTKFCLKTTKTKPIVPLILKKEALIAELKNETEAIKELIKTGIVLKGEDVLVEAINSARS